MRPEIARQLLAIAGFDTRSPKMKAVDILLVAASFVETNKPEWWRWTVWLWAGIGIRKIQGM